MARLLMHFDRSTIEPHVAVNRRDGHYLESLRGCVEVHFIGSEGDRYPVLPMARLVRRLRPRAVMATLGMTLTAGAASPFFPRDTAFVLRQANHVSLALGDARHGSVKSALVVSAYRAAFHRADLVIAQSRSMASDIETSGLHVNDMVILPNPIDVIALQRGEPCTTPLPGRPKLVTVGRLAPQKGLDILLEAMVSVVRHWPGAHLTVVGDGDERVALESQVKRLGLESRVTFVGFRDNPHDFMRSADLVVSSSRYEGFANTTLEALALGRTVVGTSGPGANDEMIIPGFNGQLVPPLDHEALASAIDVELQRQASVNRSAISADIQQRFGADSVAARYASALLDA